MKSMMVCCGSANGHKQDYMDAAYYTGQTLAAQAIQVVYGGACTGLMGAVANGALAAGGRVIGILPDFLRTKEIVHTGLTELIIVETMHERKMRMHELSDSIIALPGGFGTMEELFEMLTWAQLGLHLKPIGLLNINGFYDPLLSLVATMHLEGFLKSADADRLLTDRVLEPLLAAMENYVAPPTPVWITEETT